LLQVVIIALLVMPMPSNKVRGIIQGAVSELWHTQEYVKRTSWVLLTLNSYYLYGRHELVPVICWESFSTGTSQS
jgi:hypothetical protein